MLEGGYDLDALDELLERSDAASWPGCRRPPADRPAAGDVEGTTSAGPGSDAVQCRGAPLAAAGLVVIPDRFRPVLDELSPLTERFAAAGHRLYLVGGTVRHLLTGRGAAATSTSTPPPTARPAEIKALPCRAGPMPCGRRASGSARSAPRRTVAIYEITTHRAEAYTDDSRKPHVEFADDIEADLSRRDFTINAMALERDIADPDPRRPVRRRGRPGDANAAHAAVARGVLQRRPAAHAARGAVHRPLPAAAGCPSWSPRSPRCTAAWRSCRPSASATSSTSCITVDASERRAVVPDRDRPCRRVPAGAAGDASRAGPDPSPQGRADAHARRRRERSSRRASRLRLPPHAPGRAVPRRRQAADARLPEGQGRHLPPPRRGRCADDAQAPEGAALLATTTSRRSPSSWRCTCASTPTRWVGRTPRCAATCATPARCSPS